MDLLNLHLDIQVEEVDNNKDFEIDYNIDNYNFVVTVKVELFLEGLIVM